MANMHDIEQQTKNYADARADLATYMSALEDEKRALVRRYLRGIKKRVADAKAAKEELQALLEANPGLFEKQRTVAFHGVRVGYRKGAGKIEFDDAERVVELIRKHRPEEFDLLVKTSYKPVKDALSNLPAGDLRKLGVTVEETGDVVFIKEAATEVDKLVKALLKDDPEGDDE